MMFLCIFIPVSRIEFWRKIEKKNQKFTKKKKAVDFFNQINILFGSISEYCLQKNKTCEVMSAGPQ